MIDLAGIIPALVTPMIDGDRLDLPAIPAYVDRLAKAGAIGLAVNVDTSEGPNLAREERRAVLEAVATAGAGRCRVVAGVGGPSTRDAVTNARDAQASGADALLVFPNPAFLSQPLSAELAYGYHAAIADAADLPIILFQLQPALGGVLYPAGVLDRLLEIPAVCAIKEASFDPIRFLEVRAHLDQVDRNITLLTGNDNFIAESLLLGAEGALLGFATIGTAEHVELLAMTRRGDLPAARELGDRLQRLADVIFAAPMVDYRARTKEALCQLGWLSNPAVRPPLLQLPAEERDRIHRALVRSGLLKERVSGKAG